MTLRSPFRRKHTRLSEPESSVRLAKTVRLSWTRLIGLLFLTYHTRRFWTPEIDVIPTLCVPVGGQVQPDSFTPVQAWLGMTSLAQSPAKGLRARYH